MKNFIKPVRTLVFDVFGTVVDWRTPIKEAVTAAANETAAEGDWSALGPQFAADWKAAYRPAMERVNEGGPWINVDAIMRQRLDEIAGQYGLDGLSAARLDTLNEAWSLARPWPDSVSGLSKLHEKFVLATLSNCTFHWLVAMAKAGGLPFDAIMTSEQAGRYKPAPETYEMAITLLGIDASSLMMVACHNYDLAAAQSHGMKTAFLPRQENGSGQTTDQEAEGPWDVVATDIEDLAVRLGQ